MTKKELLHHCQLPEPREHIYFPGSLRVRVWNGGKKRVHASISKMDKWFMMFHISFNRTQTEVHSKRWSINRLQCYRNELIELTLTLICYFLKDKINKNLTIRRQNGGCGPEIHSSLLLDSVNRVMIILTFPRPYIRAPRQREEKCLHLCKTRFQRLLPICNFSGTILPFPKSW